MSQIAIHTHIKSRYRARGRESLIKRAALCAIQVGNPSLLRDEGGREMSIVLSDDAHLHELNLAFRGMDKPTDVLSFEGASIAPRYLGDIVISMDRCAEQAQKANARKRSARKSDYTTDDELALLVVHGTLHLLGYDHETNAQDKAIMWSAQKHALQLLKTQ